MGKFFSPLKVFVAGEIFILIGMLFFTTIGSTAANTAGNASAYSSTFWGVSWVLGSTRLLVFIVLELVVFGSTALAFIKGRSI